MAVRYTFVVDHPLRQAQLERELGTQHSFICTRGLLFDLPPLNRGIGIDIADAFKFTLSPIQGKEEIIRNVARLRADNLFIVTAPSEDGHRLARQVYALLRLDPRAKAHLLPDTLAGAVLTNFLTLAQPLNVPACEAAEARRTISRLAGCLLVQAMHRINTRLETPVIANLDYYGAVLLLHLMENLRESQPSQGLSLQFDNGFQAQLLKGNPRDLGKPRIFLTPHRQELIKLAKKMAETKSPLAQLSSDAQTTQTQAQFPTLAQMAAQALEGGTSLFQLLQQLDTLYSMGAINVHGSEGNLPRTALWHGLVAARAFLGIPRMPKAPQFHFPKNAIGVTDWQIATPRLGDLSDFYTTLQQASLLAAVPPLDYVESYHLYQCGEFFFWGLKRYGPKGWPPSLGRAVIGEYGADPREGNGYDIRIASRGPDRIGNFLDTYAKQSGLPYILRSLHHLLHTFQYCHISQGSIQLTDQGAQCADILWPLRAQLSPYAHQINEQGLLAIRQGKIDRTYLLNKWYSRFQPACEALVNSFR